MPPALIALTIAAYAIGTTEFVIVGLLPTVASDLSIDLPLAGLIVSVYALGVTFGAPVLTALTARLPRKPLLLGLMGLFMLATRSPRSGRPMRPCWSGACCRPLPMACSSRSGRRSRPALSRPTSAPRPLP